MSDTIKSLCFTFRQKGKQPEKGVLTVIALRGKKSIVLLIDSFTITGEMRRSSFIRKLYSTNSLNRESFPVEVLTQCLLEMASDALRWNEPPLEKVKPLPDKPLLEGLAFEMMLANHKYPPPCHLERTISAKHPSAGSREAYSSRLDIYFSRS